jgi:tRNA 2-selenouridine synthase
MQAPVSGGFAVVGTVQVSSQAVRLAASLRGVVVVGGLAGSGKTELLVALAAAGEQVLDLESLASHRGSAFGGLGLPAQPSHRAFVSAVRERLAAVDPERVLWVEDEGPFIGRVGLPPELVEELEAAPVVELRAPFEERVARVVETYASAGAGALEWAIRRSVSRLGPDVLDGAVRLVRAGDFAAAARLLLPVYDAAYAHRNARHGRQVLRVAGAASGTGAADDARLNP